MPESEIINNTNLKPSKETQLPVQIDTENNKKVFRPIHYLGSKLRLLDEIDYFINKVAPNCTTVCDLFAGSGTVSQHFISTHNVISVDIQEYSKVISSAISAPSNSTNTTASTFVNKCRKSKLLDHLYKSSESLIKFESDAIDKSLLLNLDDACDLLEDGSLEIYRNENQCKNSSLKKCIEETLKSLTNLELLDSKKSMCLRYFGGVYFSYKQAAAIDSILEEINQLPLLDKNTFLAALLSSVSDIVNTVGKQFAQPIKPRKSDGSPKPSLKNQLIKDRFYDLFKIYEKWLEKYLCLPKATNNHFSIKSDYAAFLEVNKHSIDVIYADPPYTRDHYSRYYHILETICLRDNPQISSVKTNGVTSLSRGIYRENRHQSPFCIVSQAPSAFDKLFKESSSIKAPIIVSYSPFAKEGNNRPRVVGIDTITKIASQYYDCVEVVSVGKFSHSKLNHSAKNYETPEGAEVLIVCKLS
ncbi:DNA adenine methylase [Pseudoalteromonas agarivorans]|uniref:DNA adenine methylase n=1 Tax=Pseudoalteromonas agarivorans TaxID=176102 RepID=UPI00311FB7B5